MNNPLITCLPIVIFHHQGHRFALEAQYISRQGQVVGLEDDAFIRFSDLLMPNEQTVVTVVQWLELLGQSGHTWRLGLEVPAELVELPIDCIHPLPSLLQARRQFPALQALAWYQGALVALLSVDGLYTMAEQLSLNHSM